MLKTLRIWCLQKICLALYFLGYLENKILGKVNQSTIEKLENRLRHTYTGWKDFEQYHPVDHLRNRNFNLMRDQKIKS